MSDFVLLKPNVVLKFDVNEFPDWLKMLGLYLYTLTISHTSCNMSVLNKLSLQKKLLFFL